MEITLTAKDTDNLSTVFGPFDENIETIEKELGVRIISRGDMLSVSGEKEQAGKVRTRL